jgi:hypothetical protein
MLNRWGLILATGLLMSSSACTGAISDDSSTPETPPAAAAAGAGGSSVEATGATTATSPGASASSENETGGTGSETEDVSDELELPELPPIEYCDAPTKVLVKSCGNGSCHSNANVTMGDFAVDPQRAYNFVDRVSTRNASCGRIIDSRDYSKSLMLTKVRGDFEAPKCGERMPIGSFVITSEQISCLASWLQQFQL